MSGSLEAMTRVVSKKPTFEVSSVTVCWLSVPPGASACGPKGAA
ncbi:MAG: hypothetical protein M5U20_04455 [Phycisphaerales bacterium]|nr:hypothetical protein [Phycisphaerales bacterium]